METEERTGDEGWLTDLAERLDVAPLTGQETGQILRVARDVAHGVERRFAPLASFLLGVAVAEGGRRADGRDAALAAAVEKVRAALPPGDR